MKRQCTKFITLSICVFVFFSIVSIHKATFAQEPNQPPIPSESQVIQVVGGEQAIPHAWPWQAAIFNGPYICGGTLIDPSWVLTAAHCLPEGTDANNLLIVLGAHNIYLEEDSQQRLEVDYFVTHEFFEPSNFDNDIALIKLDTPATLNEYVQTISLVGGQDYANQMAMIVGWGTTVTGGAGSDVLLQAELPVVPIEQCRNWFEESFGFAGWITDNMICAGYEEGGVDSCQGDSGGPLMVADGEDGWLQVGIVSWGIGCAGAKKPGIYTNLSIYTDWVREQLIIGRTVDAAFTVYLPLVAESTVAE